MPGPEDQVQERVQGHRDDGAEAEHHDDQSQECGQLPRGRSPLRGLTYHRLVAELSPACRPPVAIRPVASIHA